jgi:CheY-like chemotaxis protein
MASNDAMKALGNMPAGPQRSLKILHVDDDPVNLLAMDHMLQVLGHSAVGVPCGADALERLRAECFDLMLCDIHMPEMDGVALLRRVRTLSAEARAMPVVAVTADVMTRAANAYRELGFAGAIAKPLLIPALTHVLECASRPPEKRVFAASGMAKA